MHLDCFRAALPFLQLLLQVLDQEFVVAVDFLLVAKLFLKARDRVMQLVQGVLVLVLEVFGFDVELLSGVD